MDDASTTPGWTFLTSHAQVLVCIAHDPGVRVREIGERIGITERAAHRIVTDLSDAGYITRRRDGRRNHYTVNTHFPLPDPVARERNVGQLLAVLLGPPPEEAGRAVHNEQMIAGPTPRGRPRARK